MIIALLIIFVVLLITTYLIFKKDILQPAVIFIAMYTISIACACLNIRKWNIELNLTTFLVILIGAIEFIIINYLIYRKMRKRQNINNTENDYIKESNIDKWKLIIVLLFNITVIGLMLKNVLSIASQYGQFSGLSEALTIFKQHTSYSNDASLPKYMAWLQKFTYPLAYIMSFYYIKEIVFSEDKKLKTAIKKIYYLIPAVCFVIQELLTSNRLSTLALCIGIFVMTILLVYEKEKWNKTIKLKSVLGIGCIACTLLISFYFSAKLVGRKNSKNMIDYITLYCGGSIDCLNLYFENPPSKENYIIGQESFYYFVKNLRDYKIINIEELPTIHLEFRYNENTMIGNVYTAYRRWINDFGFVGAFILQAIMAICYSYAYNKIKNIRKEKDFCMIMYAYLAYPLFLHCIDGYFYLLTVRIAFVTTFIIFVLVYLFLTKYKICFKRKENEKIDN